MSIVVGVLVSGWLATSAGSAAIPKEVERAFRDASLDAIDGDLSPAELAKTREHGWSEEKVGQWLQLLLAKCLGQSEPCDELEAMATADRARAARALIQAMSPVVTSQSAPLLWRLQRRGSVDAARALEMLRARKMQAAIEQFACTPPTQEETAEAWSTLADFWAVRTRGGALMAERPTSAEMDDVAYFYAATQGAHLFDVGKAEPAARPVGWLKPGPRDDTRDAIARKFRQAQDQGDMPAIVQTARSYLSTLGYPGPLRVREESHYAGGGARYSYVMRALAEADELAGEFREAAALFRRADPGGGRSGTAVEFRWQAQIRGVIASEERAGRCRAAVPERLLDIDGDDPEDVYGPTRLTRAGFDVPRLYRGALVTMYRDADLEQLAATLTDPDANARLGHLGPEAWEYRVRALEGWAATERRAAMPQLLLWAQAGLPETRVRALKALGSLVERPLADPCDSARHVKGRAPSFEGKSWRRPIPPLSGCGEVLTAQERDTLAKQLSPLLFQPDESVRTAAAQAMGRIGSLAMQPDLRRLLTERRRIHPHRSDVIAESARVALKSLSRFKPARPSPMKGMARLRRILRTQ